MTRALFLAALLPLIFSACATAPGQPPASAMAESPAPEDDADEAEATGPQAQKPAKPEPKGPDLPKQELSEEILFQYLLGEIASQRGNAPVAAGTYLELARRTRDPRIAQRATELALQARLTTTAVEAASVWLSLDPDSARARQTLAALLVAAGRLDEARPQIEKLLAADKGNVAQGFLQLNNLLSRHPDKAAVLRLVQGLAEPYPDLPEAWMAVAQSAWYAGRFDLALEAARKAASLRPDWELAALFQAQILQRVSGPAEAAASLREFLGKYPKSREVRLTYARLLVSEKDYNGARAEFQRLLKDFPANPEVTVAVGLLSMQLKDYDQAESSFKAALAGELKEPDTIRFHLGQLAEERKRYEEALKWYREVGAGDQYHSAQIRQAFMLAKLGKLDEARDFLRQIPAQNIQQRAQLVMAEAQLLRDGGRYQESFDVLSRALEKMPNTPDLLYDHAMAAEKLDRIDVLESNLRTLIQIKPDHAHAYNALGYSLADRSQRLEEAKTLIQKAVELAPEDPFIRDSLGWVLFRTGDLDASIAELRRAYAARPDPEIAAHLGEVLWAKGDKREAEQLWRTALKEHPGNEVLIGTVKRFLP